MNAEAGPEPQTPEEEAALEELVWELNAPHTLEEIAERLGKSRRTVRRIEQGALERLRGLMVGDWQGGVDEPKTLSLRTGESGADNGMTPRRPVCP